MRAAVYARYSSENQRKESIDDQISACRRLAKEQGLEIVDNHIYADEARSGARKDRPAFGPVNGHRFSPVAAVRTLNEEGVAGQFKTAKGWSPATISRILDSEKYVGRWIWNRTESRRDPRTGKRRRFEKPESEWIAREDEGLRIVPSELWEAVRERRKKVKRSWPGGKGKRGFSAEQGSRQDHFPTHLLSGTMKCGACGAALAQVSGKAGGYYGCLGAAKGACDNKMLVRRRLAEKGDR